nr:uncharacterized protein LOC127328180 [Lolium perenne]
MAQHLVKNMSRRQRETGATHHHLRITRVTAADSSPAPGNAIHPWSSAAARAHPWSRAHQIAQAAARHPRPRRPATLTAGDASQTRLPSARQRRKPPPGAAAPTPKSPHRVSPNNHPRTSTYPNPGKSRGAAGLERRTWTGAAAGGDISAGEPRAATSLHVAVQRSRGPRSPPSPSLAPWSSTGSASGGGKGRGRAEGGGGGEG